MEVTILSPGELFARDTRIESKRALVPKSPAFSGLVLEKLFKAAELPLSITVAKNNSEYRQQSLAIISPTVNGVAN